MDIGIGKLITGDAQRDAIHVAVCPVIANENLYPGDEIGFVIEGDTQRVGHSPKPIGIVDPFLPGRGAIVAGSRFWAFLIPGSITSLRHEWAHPAFGDQPTERVTEPTAVDVSRKWIEDFAAKIDQTYNRLMCAASDWVQYGEYTYDNTERYKDHWDEFPEFWKHYEVVTGTKVKDHEDHFFTCSC